MKSSLISFYSVKLNKDILNIKKVVRYVRVEEDTNTDLLFIE